MYFLFWTFCDKLPQVLACSLHLVRSRKATGACSGHRRRETEGTGAHGGGGPAAPYRVHSHTGRIGTVSIPRSNGSKDLHPTVKWLQGSSSHGEMAPRVFIPRSVASLHPQQLLPAAPPPRTKCTRRVPHPVLIGHAAPLDREPRRIIPAEVAPLPPRAVVVSQRAQRHAEAPQRKEHRRARHASCGRARARVSPAARGERGASACVGTRSARQPTRRVRLVRGEGRGVSD